MRLLRGMGAVAAVALVSFTTIAPSEARPGFHRECVQYDKWHGTRCVRWREVPDMRPGDERSCSMVCVAWSATPGALGGKCIRRAMKCGMHSAKQPLH